MMDNTDLNDDAGQKAFRFYDNRQKYLMFVNTCNEKWAVAERVTRELNHLKPQPPALRLFDAGMGDGTVLTNVMRELHKRFPAVPLFVVGKEISVEDVRLGLEKMPDRFFEHPSTVLVITNLYYTEAPWLMPRSDQAAAMLNWQEVPLEGSSSADYHYQIKELTPMLAQGWRAKASEKSGNPLYVKPSVLVLYRKDHQFMLNNVIPHPRQSKGRYDIVIASQPYRSRMPAEFKVQKVLAPLARSLGPGGRMVVVHSHGNDPGLAMVRYIWPEEDPFPDDRHQLIEVLKKELSATEHNLQYRDDPDEQSIFRYHMHTLPSEIGSNIGTSTLFAAWNAAVYVAQIEDQRLEAVMTNRLYLDATSEVLREHGGLWFNDESFVISRRGFEHRR